MEPHREAGPGHQLERLVFFSDAVFAIAITLLIIEIHPPHLHAGDAMAEQLAALARLSPSIVAFLISFFVIGAFWAGHHRLFALAGHWDERLFFANSRLLLAIVAMPFFTAFMSVNSFARLPVALYAGWMLLAALFNIQLQRLVLAPPIVAEGIDADQVARLRIRGRAVALGAGSALVATLVLPVPGVGMILLATMPLWRMVLTRLARRRAAAVNASA